MRTWWRFTTKRLNAPPMAEVQFWARHSQSEVDAGSWFRGGRNFAGERIPTIEEVLAFGREANVGLYLEMKAAGGEGALVRALHAAKQVERTIALSFHLNILVEMRRLDQSIATGFLYSEQRRDGVEQALGAGARQLLPRSDRVTRELVEETHRQGLKVVAWTVNDPSEMKDLMGMGIDGIITNYPDRLHALVHG
jgi:glycerophosphoryl diester phosphodiesterase